MMILEDYVDTWYYSFFVVAFIALCIGAILAVKNIKKQDLKKRREKRSGRVEDK